MGSKYLSDFKKTIILPAVAMLLVGLQGCLGIVEKPRGDAKTPTTLKLTADSGYVSKKEILTFLASNSLTDTLNDWWKHWKVADTMGKYYKMEGSGNYLLCVLSANTANNSVEVNKLIELSKDGKLVTSQEFYSEGCDMNHRTQALGRVGNYFVTYSCGHGAGFSSSWIHLFSKLSDREGGGEIMKFYHATNIPCKNISSKWYMAGDTCVVNYTNIRTKNTEDGCIPVDSQKVLVRYYAVNGKWRAADSSRIKQMEITQ